MSTTKVCRAPCARAASRHTGDRADPSWTKGEGVADFVDYREQDRPATTRTRVRLLYDTRHLYLRVDGDEPGIAEPKSAGDARDTGLDRWPAGYSIEVFLRPDSRSLDYYQLAAGLFGGRYDGKGKDASWNGRWRAAAKRTPNGWTLEMAVPFADFGVTPPQPGEAWGFNICRNGAGTSTWVPIGVDFHRPDRFGLLIFGEYGDWWKKGFGDAWRAAARDARRAIEEKSPGNHELRDKVQTAEDACEALERDVAAAGGVASRERFLPAFDAAQRCLARFPALDAEIELTRRMTAPEGALDAVGAEGPALVLGNARRLANGALLRVFYVGYAQVSWRDVPEDIRQYHPRGGRILAVRSTDGGKTWSAPITVVDDGNDNRAPMLAEEPNGTLVCHFVALATRPAYGALALVRSYDGGLAWEKEPTRITAEPYAFTASQVSGKRMEVEVGEPRLAALGPVGETRWGHWQFPTLSKLRDGRLLLSVNVEDDSMLSYGKPGRPFISRDSGKTWAPADLRREGLPDALALGAFSPVLAVPNGDLVVFVIQPNVARRDVPHAPAVATVTESYEQVFSWYRARELPRELSVVKMLRLPRGSDSWVEEEAFLDIPDRLVDCDEKSGLIPRAMFCTGSFARADDGSLLFVAPMKVLEPDGRVPAKLVNYCLRSTDGGRTWKMRGRVAYNPYAYQDDLAEPDLCATADGTLVCVLRTTDGKGLGPMLLTSSRDAGETWSPLRLLENFGVMPRLLTLENGVTVLSYGRPGVRLLFSADGAGQCWEHPVTILPGPSMDKRIDWYSMEAESCGNNSQLIPLAPDRFIMAYSDFTHKDAAGHVRKAIFVREVRVRVKP